MVVYSSKKCGEYRYLTPHAFWNITDFGAKCEKCEQKPDRLDRSPIICPKCKNAVYVPNLTTYSCPYCSVEVEVEVNLVPS